MSIVQKRKAPPERGDLILVFSEDAENCESFRYVETSHKFFCDEVCDLEKRGLCMKIVCKISKKGCYKREKKKDGN